MVELVDQIMVLLVVLEVYQLEPIVTQELLEAFQGFLLFLLVLEVLSHYATGTIALVVAASAIANDRRAGFEKARISVLPSDRHFGHVVAARDPHDRAGHACRCAGVWRRSDRAGGVWHHH